MLHISVKAQDMRNYETQNQDESSDQVLLYTCIRVRVRVRIRNRNRVRVRVVFRVCTRFRIYGRMYRGIQKQGESSDSTAECDSVGSRVFAAAGEGMSSNFMGGVMGDAE